MNPTVQPDGTQEWYQNGKLHREDGPAIIESDGAEWWYKNGVPHRDDGPAIIQPNGTQYWYQNGVLHREDGPALTWSNDTQYWYRGKYYPTVESDIEWAYLKMIGALNKTSKPEQQTMSTTN